ncbi:MAG: glycosyltransferase [Calditrichia bacterium]|nr:glycosyltransferase [Calditrichia bacterium]
MTEKDSITVIITSYNRREIIGRAVDSVLGQTRPADEIILVDDGSSDNTDQLIKEKYPDIKYIWQVNRGVSHARNTGISQARGIWIAFLDSDDEWLPSKLKDQLKALQHQPDYKICHTNEIWIRNGKRVNPMKKHEKSGGLIFKNCLPLCIISPSSVIIHRSVFEEYGLFDESLPVCEDYDLWLRFCAFLPILYVEKPQIIKYGGHSDQLSHKYWGMDRFRIIALEKIIKNPKLSPEDKDAATHILIEKIEIYIQGAAKRRKGDELELYEAKKTKYLQMLQARFS